MKKNLILGVLLLLIISFTNSCSKKTASEIGGKELVSSPASVIINFEGHWLHEGDREKLLREMLQGFNDGRSKTYYSIAATVMQIEELNAALSQARRTSRELETKEKSAVLHRLLDEIAVSKRYVLKLRKYKPLR